MPRSLILCAALTALGIQSTSAAPLPLAPVSAGDPFASCRAGSDVKGDGINFPASEVEPFVAADPQSPKQLIAVWQQDRWSNGAARGQVSAYSTDGGASWTRVTVPFGTCADASSPFTRVSDPWVSTGPDGIAYTSAIAYSGKKTSVLVATSRDGGRTWSGASTVLEQNAGKWFEDKDSITADPVKPGTAYVTWTRDPLTARPPASTFLSITHDGGASWSKAKAIVNPGNWGTTTGNIIAVNPRDGALFDVFELQVEHTVVKKTCKQTKPALGKKSKRVCTKHRVAPSGPPSYTNSLQVSTSHDGGNTWSHPTHVADVTDADFAGRAGPLRTGGALPTVAVDPHSRTLYVAWADGAFTAGNSLEIALTSSTDDGSTWSTPVRVSSPQSFAAFDPAIAVAPDSTIAVTYDDLRTWDRSDTTHVPTECWAILSHDGGKTFGGERLLAGPFDMATAPSYGEPDAPAGGYFLGDYQGLTASSSTFTAVFATTTVKGTKNPTDIVATSFGR